MKKLEEIQQGTMVSYSGLGDSRIGIVTSSDHKKLKIDLGFSVLTMTIKNESTLKSLGLKIIISPFEYAIKQSVSDCDIDDYIAETEEMKKERIEKDFSTFLSKITT